MDFLPGILPFYAYKTLLWLDNMSFGDPQKKDNPLKKMQFNMQDIFLYLCPILITRESNLQLSALIVEISTIICTWVVIKKYEV